jgi:hypothetical protein
MLVLLEMLIVEGKVGLETIEDRSFESLLVFIGKRVQMNKGANTWEGVKRAKLTVF